VDKDELRELYSQVVERVIEQYFFDESNVVLLGYFRNHPNVLCEIASKHKSDSIEDVSEVFEGTSMFYDTIKSQLKYLTTNANHLTDIDEIRRKVNKFDALFSLECLNNFPISDEEKLSLYKSHRIGLNRLVIAEGDEGLKNFLSLRFDFINNEIEILEEKIKSKAQKQPNIKMSSFWYYTPEQLNLLSERLYQSQFINNPSSFRQVFSSNYKTLCDWTKNRTSILYLFWLLNNRHGQFPDPSIIFIAERFTFKGKPTNSKLLHTQHRQIENVFIAKEEYLKGQYLTIYKICKSAIPTL